MNGAEYVAVDRKRSILVCHERDAVIVMGHQGYAHIEIVLYCKAMRGVIIYIAYEQVDCVAPVHRNYGPWRVRRLLKVVDAVIVTR